MSAAAPPDAAPAILSFAPAMKVKLAAELPPSIKIPFHPTYSIDRAIDAALEEDVADVGDISTLATIPASTKSRATLLAKADGILAGQALCDRVLARVDPDLTVAWARRDGETIHRGEVFMEVHGSARSILRAERVLLNFMQRMSGIATLTNRMATAAAPALMLETRKTAPGLRLLDKWAVLIGGGRNHRMGLFDMIMIKDNHIAAAGGIKEAIVAAEAFLKQR